MTCLSAPLCFTIPSNYGLILAPPAPCCTALRISWNPPQPHGARHGIRATCSMDISHSQSLLSEAFIWSSAIAASPNCGFVGSSSGMQLHTCNGIAANIVSGQYWSCRRMPTLRDRARSQFQTMSRHSSASSIFSWHLLSWKLVEG